MESHCRQKFLVGGLWVGFFTPSLPVLRSEILLFQENTAGFSENILFPHEVQRLSAVKAMRKRGGKNQN